MLTSALVFNFLLAAVLSARALTAQLPLSRPVAPAPSSSPKTRLLGQFTSDDVLDWDKEPDEDAAGRFIFNSASELMQLWAGHVIVEGQSYAPAIIPAGTVLYHGRPDGSMPTVPEWVAFDFEHSYWFAWGEEGHVLTVATRHPMRVLIFDAMSAHMSLDTQDILVYGKVTEGDRFRSATRDGRGKEKPPFGDPQGVPLCEWGKKHGIEGFIRLEMNHELVACDFDASFNLLEAVHVIGPEPRKPPSPHTPPRPEGWVGSLPTEIGMEVYAAAKWHYRFPGETRVKPLYSKFVTFYDPAVTSVVESRRGKTRDHHRLQSITEAEAKMKVRELEEAVARSWDESAGSGIDWQSILHVVVERYGDRLEVLNHTLSSSITTTSSLDDAYSTAFNARQQVLMMLVPHFTTSDTPPANASASTSKTWLTPVWQRCATRHTQGISTERFTPQEHLILGAVEDVMAEICRRLTRVFHLSHDIQSPLTAALRDPYEEEKIRLDLVRVVNTMGEEISTLMEWLDWVQVWSRCRPACSIEEVCVASSPNITRIPLTGDSDLYAGRQSTRLVAGSGGGGFPWHRGSGGQRIPICERRPHF